MINNINDLARHRRFIDWLSGRKTARLLVRGGGGHANFAEKKVTSPSLPQNTPPLTQTTIETTATPAALAAITLSNALAITTLPPITLLPRSRNGEPNSARYKRIAKLWRPWLSNARAIADSVWLRGINIDEYTKKQFELTEALINEFRQFERYYN